jgi:hypothetical protein
MASDIRSGFEQRRRLSSKKVAAVAAYQGKNKPMRQGQQNRRGRGRGGRKPQNPLARSYESNGPDVKIRGTAAHIAEKYMSLARDALSSGDLVGAESYFQHAEHYNRIIMAAQSQFGSQGGQAGEGANGGGFRPRWNADGSDSLDEGGSDMDSPDAMSGVNEVLGRGRREYGQHRGPNGGEAPARDGNGNDQADPQQADESTDTVS